MYGRVIYQDQKVYVNDMEVNGVQSASLSYDVPLSPIFVAGTGLYSQENSGPLEGSVQIERYIVSSEDFLTGLINRNVSGCLAYKKTSDISYLTNGFLDGIITSYSIECAVGEIAKSNVSLSVYGNMGSGIVAVGAEVPYAILIAKPGDLIMSLPDAVTNRVQSISYEASIPYSRKDYIGAITGQCNKIQTDGVNIDLSVSFHADDLNSPVLFDQLCADTELISFRFENCEGDVIRSFSMPDARFLGVSNSATIGGNLSFDFKYRSTLSDASQLARYLSTEGSGAIVMPPFELPCNTVHVQGSPYANGIYGYDSSGIYGYVYTGKIGGVDNFLYGNPNDWQIAYAVGGTPYHSFSEYYPTGDWGGGVTVTCFNEVITAECETLSVSNSLLGYNGTYTFYEYGAYGLAWKYNDGMTDRYIYGLPYNWYISDYYGLGSDHSCSAYSVVEAYSWTDGVIVTCL